MTQEDFNLEISAEALLPLALDIWRLQQRTNEDESGNSFVKRIGTRLNELGFSFETYSGEYFDENLKVRVIEHQIGDGERTITACLTPAILFKGQLLKAANVTTTGRKA